MASIEVDDIIIYYILLVSFEMRIIISLIFLFKLSHNIIDVPNLLQ